MEVELRVPTITPLRWVERALIACALLLGLTWGLQALRMEFYASLPVPRADVTRLLPGDAGTSGAASSSGTSSSIAPGAWVARLEIESVGLTATVIEGSTDDMLARAAGHIEQTALPGEPGNVGIAGHRDTTFRAIRRIQPGNVIRLRTANGLFRYRVDRTFIVKPEDVFVLDPTPTPSVTLVTCYPFTFIGHAPKRFIVRGTLIE